MKRLSFQYIFNNIAISAIILSYGTASAQDASPVVSFNHIEQTDKTTEFVELKPGESKTTQAPLEITLTANVDTKGGEYTYIPEWRIYRSDEGESKPVVTRFVDDSNYTLTKSGGYGIKLYVTFVRSEDNDTIEYESEPIEIVISESTLTVPDGFSPNNDDINDVLHISYQSIVKLSGGIWNRWGKKLHEFNLGNIDEGWDGKVGGEYVPDGGYILNIDATGSDGLHYKIRKVINVLKGYKTSEETTGGN